MKILQINVVLILIVLFCCPCFADENDNIIKELNSGAKPKYTITVTQNNQVIGKIVIELFPEIAPKHCRNFDSLVAIKFYDGTKFHRVKPHLMIQGGDPNSKKEPKSLWGFGDATQTRITAEFNKLKHIRGILSMAREDDINSATSQFFICHDERPSWDGKYSIFGRVIEGIGTVDTIVETPRDETNHPIEDVVMTITKNN